MGFTPPEGSPIPLEDGLARCFLGPFFDYVRSRVNRLEDLSSDERAELEAHLRAHNETCDDAPKRCVVCQFYTFLDEHPLEEWRSFKPAH
jgi:hypothetical protein